MKTKQREFSIGDTAKMTGVSQKQLRFWEAKEYIAPPTRVISGHRSYRYFSEKQVEQVKAIKRLLDEGYTLSFASKTVRKEGRKDA